MATADRAEALLREAVTADLPAAGTRVDLVLPVTTDLRNRS
jgi:hypothetical protein